MRLETKTEDGVKNKALKGMLRRNSLSVRAVWIWVVGAAHRFGRMASLALDPGIISLPRNPQLAGSGTKRTNDVIT